eukprot:6197201-Prymnesium_polylepis.1
MGSMTDDMREDLLQESARHLLDEIKDLAAGDDAPALARLFQTQAKYVAQRALWRETARRAEEAAAIEEASTSSDSVAERLAGRGMLVVRRLRASGLKAADKDGSSDPYVIVQLGGAKRRTLAFRNSLDPHWDDVFEFEGLLLRDVVGGRLQLKVFDTDAVGKDDKLGEVSVELTPLQTLDRCDFSRLLSTQGSAHFECEWRRSAPHAGGSVSMLLETLGDGMAEAMGHRPDLRERLSQLRGVELPSSLRAAAWAATLRQEAEAQRCARLLDGSALTLSAGASSSLPTLPQHMIGRGIALVPRAERPPLEARAVALLRQ